MDDVQNADAGGLEELLAGIEQSDATEEAEADSTANAETPRPPRTRAPKPTPTRRGRGAQGRGRGRGRTAEAEEAVRLRAAEASHRGPRGTDCATGSPAPVAGDEKALASAVEAEIGAPPKESEFPDWFAYERALTAYETEKRIVSRELKGKAAQAEQLNPLPRRRDGRGPQGPPRGPRKAAPGLEGQDRSRRKPPGRTPTSADSSSKARRARTCSSTSSSTPKSSPR
jgi:hypothetical protein